MIGKADAAARTLDALGVIAAIRRLPAWNGLVVLCYHRIGDAGASPFDRRLYSASQDQFDRQVRELSRHVELVAGDDILRALAAPRGRHVAITFDDGYRDNHDLAAPVLRAHGAPATFFLATGFLDRPHLAWWDEVAWMLRASSRDALPASPWLPDGLPLDGSDSDATIAILDDVAGRLASPEIEALLDWLQDASGVARPGHAEAAETWMTWDMARAMRRQGLRFGGHTVDHSILARCSVAEQGRQISGSLDRVEAELGERPRVFAYPQGSMDAFTMQTRECLRAAGVTCALSFYGGWQRAGSGHPLDVRRLYVSPSMTSARFRAQVALPGVFARGPRPPAEPAPETAAPAADGVGSGAASWGGSVKRGMAWSVLAFSASKALSLISILVLARLLTPAEFGVVAAVAAYIALVELGSDLGMKPAVVYEQEPGITRRVQTAFTLNLAMATVLTVIGVLLAPLVAKLFGAADHADLFRLGALNLLLTALGNIHDGVLLRDMSFSVRIRPQVARDVMRVAVSVALAFAGLGASALVIGFLAGSAGWVVLQWALVPLRPALVLDIGAAREMIGYGAAAALLEVMAVIAGRIDVVVIGALIGTSALGIYTIAYRLPDVLLAGVAYTLAVVAFPALARKREESADALAYATLALLRYQALYALPVAAILCVLSVPIITGLFGNVWAGAAPAMVAVSAGLAVSTATFPLGDLLKAVGKQSTLVKLNLLNVPLLAAGCVLAAPAGVTAVAWALGGARLLFGIAMCVIVAREIGARGVEMLRALGPGAAAALGAGAGALAIRLTWTHPLWPSLIAAAMCAGAGGALVLRLLAPATYGAIQQPAMLMLRSRLGRAPA